MRSWVPTGLALILATQGVEAIAAGRTWHHSGARAHSGAHVHRFRSAPVVVRPVRVVPRTVYVAPYVPYASTPYYATPAYAPSYYPSSAYSAPSYAPPAYAPPAPPSYAEPQPYPPPPPAPPPAQAQSGPYAMEQGLQYRYLCLDTRQFYPDTKECPSGWLTVLPGGGTPPR